MIRSSECHCSNDAVAAALQVSARGVTYELQIDCFVHRNTLVLGEGPSGPGLCFSETESMPGQ
jgi:hypothetical protein